MMRRGSIDRADPRTLLKMEQIARFMMHELEGAGFVDITLDERGSVHCTHEVGGPDDEVRFVTLDIESPDKEAVVEQC